MAGYGLFDLSQRDIPFQLDGEGLAVAAHGADAHAAAVDGDLARGQTEDLVGLGHALPLLPGLAVVHGRVDPGDEAAGQGRAEIGGRERWVAQGLDHVAVQVEDGRGRVVEQLLGVLAHQPHLVDQLAHVLRARARGGLVGLAAHPLHPVPGEQPAERHEHQAHRAVAADVFFDPPGQGLVDHRPVHRVEHDHRVRIEPQLGGRVDPVALPAAGHELRVDLSGVAAALAAEDDVVLRQQRRIGAVEQLVHRAVHLRPGLAGLGGGKETGFVALEIPFLPHPLHEHRADHAAPADNTYFFHDILRL